MINSSTQISRLEKIRYPVAACLLVGCFLAFIYNRFLPAQDAWFPSFGEMIQHGKMPYRDFYCSLQPIPLLMARILVGFSHRLIYFRYYACLERLALTAALYWMLRQQFTRFSSFLGTVTSVILITSFSVDALYSYYITCLLFTLLALGCLARAVMPEGAGQGFLFRLSGIFLGLAFYTKQSYGGLIGFSFLFALVVVGTSWRGLLYSVVKVGAGFSLVGLPLLLGLWAEGLLPDYVRDVYLNVASQKGGPAEIFTGFFSRLDQAPFLAVVALAAVVTLILLASGLLVLRKSGAPRPESGPALFYGTLMMGLLALIVPIRFSSTVVPWVIESKIYIGLLYINPVVFYATAALLLYMVTHRRIMLLGRPSCNPGLLVLASGSMAGLYAMGMSYEISSQAMAPCLGIVLAFLIDFLQPDRRRFATYGAVGFSVLLIFVGATKKYLSTYWWYGWEDTSLHPPGHSRLPELAGFDLDPPEIAIYERVVDLVEQGSKPGEHLFTFPNIPMFNYLTNRTQPTFAPVHYFDVSPDSVDAADAARLLADPPRRVRTAFPRPVQQRELPHRGVEANVRQSALNAIPPARAR